MIVENLEKGILSKAKIITFPEVYGSVYDERERLVPSLMINALTSSFSSLFLNSSLSSNFSFIHVSDAVKTISNAIRELEENDQEVSSNSTVLSV